MAEDGYQPLSDAEDGGLVPKGWTPPPGKSFGKVTLPAPRFADPYARKDVPEPPLRHPPPGGWFA